MTSVLLDQLPQQERQDLISRMRRDHLVHEEGLYHADGPMPYVYFPIDCLITVLAMRGSTEVEAVTVGREGMLGLRVFLRSRTSPLRAICQLEGDAWRMGADAFLDAARPGSTLHHLLLVYSYARYVEAAQNLACNRAHSIVQQCARWLLLAQDRSGRDHFRVTQETLGRMLGARRASVTEAMGALQQQGAISYWRGDVSILNRSPLEGLACDCYRLVTQQYDQLLS